MAYVSHSVDLDTSRWSYSDPGNTAVMETESKPGFGWELKSTTQEVSNNIGMTNKDIITVLLLVRFCTMEILPESSFDPGSIFEELLHGEERNEERNEEGMTDNQLTFASGLQLLDGGSGRIGAPSRRKLQLVTSTSGSC